LVLHTYIGVHWCAERLLWTTMVNASPFLETAPSLKDKSSQLFCV